MENKIVNSLKDTMNSLKETIANAVFDLKEDIKVNISLLANVKTKLRADFDVLNEISDITDDMSIAMEMATEEIMDSCVSVEEILDIIDPQEEEEEEEEEDCLVVEDTESGEETEYPIN